MKSFIGTYNYGAVQFRATIDLNDCYFCDYSLCSHKGGIWSINVRCIDEIDIDAL